jgi:uncharacterized protein YqfA (UPF0365 family)
MISHPFILGFFAGALSALALFFIAFLIKPWFRALLSGVPIPLSRIVFMKMRGTSVDIFTDALIIAAKRGEQYDPDLLEAVYLSNRIKVSNGEELLIETQKRIAEKKA